MKHKAVIGTTLTLALTLGTLSALAAHENTLNSAQEDVHLSQTIARTRTDANGDMEISVDGTTWERYSEPDTTYDWSPVTFEDVQADLQEAEAALADPALLAQRADLFGMSADAYRPQLEEYIDALHRQIADLEAGVVMEMATTPQGDILIASTPALTMSVTVVDTQDGTLHFGAYSDEDLERLLASALSDGLLSQAEIDAAMH